MTTELLPAIAALTFHANRDAEAHLTTTGRGRRRGAPTDQATARDITHSAVEDVIGPRPARHRKEQQS